MRPRERMAETKREVLRRYTPLTILVVALLVTGFGLPSVLNLPQANPSEVLEYAPVPPDSDTNPPPGGNIAGLGLGSSSSLAQGLGGSLAGGAAGSGIGKRSKFRCVVVNGVARQTEDPLSPPCVGTFEGDNGGATYQGVTRSEISVVFYRGCVEAANPNRGTWAPTAKGSEKQRCNTMVDLDKPPSEDDFLITRGLKRYAAYFNARFQTYNRHVHMYVFYGTSSPTGDDPDGAKANCDPDCLRKDAARTMEQWKPLAVMPSNVAGDFYSEAMAQKNVMNFVGAGTPGLAQTYPGLFWSYNPSPETQASLFGSFLCQEAAGRQVSFSGNAADAQKTRKFGIIYWDRANQTFYKNQKQLVEKQLANCGGGDPPEAAYTDSGSVGDPSTRPTKATQLQDLRLQGVTTLLYIGAQNGEWTRAAQSIDWYPEWFVFGDGVMEDFVTGRYTEQSVWSHAWVVTNQTVIGRQEEQPCAIALREVDPNYPTVDITWLCPFYPVLRQLFTGIQVAGPKVTPETIESGFRAIPAVPSSSPQVPACYYLENDYTCVKDAMTMWWDPEGVIRGWSGRGCYRVPEEGRRFIANQWPEVEASARRNPSKDVCNGYTSNSSFNPHAQTG